MKVMFNDLEFEGKEGVEKGGNEEREEPGAVILIQCIMYTLYIIQCIHYTCI